MSAEQMVDGGWRFRDDGRGWELDPSQERRVRKVVGKALKRIDKRQRLAPTCRLCGQRCTRLDRAGLCSKTSGEHQRMRHHRG